MKDSNAPQFYCALGYRPEGSVGYLMRQIINNVGQEVERQLAHADLTNAQWIPLYKVYSKRASTVAELARECQLDAGSMTRMLDRLEAKGLCQRRRSEEDRRVVHIELTPLGMSAAAEIPKVLSGVQRPLGGIFHRRVRNAQEPAGTHSGEFQIDCSDCSYPDNIYFRRPQCGLIPLLPPAGHATP